MVRIRLKRMGRKNRPFYRIIVADSRRARDGRFIETLGWYDPTKKHAEGTDPLFQINRERSVYWLLNGAQASTTVNSLLRRAGVLKAFHEARKPQPKAA
jgi:small subunit ribosomal protein S16